MSKAETKWEIQTVTSIKKVKEEFDAKEKQKEGKNKDSNIWGDLKKEIEKLLSKSKDDEEKKVLDIIKDICEYNSMEIHDRLKNKGIYVANKAYLRSNYFKIWEELRGVQWHHANSVLKLVMKPVGWWSDHVAIMKDAVNYPKELVVETLLSAFLNRTNASNSTDKFYVALAGILSILGVMGESLSFIETTGRNKMTKVIVFMLSELNRAIIGSSLSYKTIFRLMLRIFELMGVVKTSYVFNAMSLLKTTPEYILQDSPLAKHPAFPKFLKGELSEEQASGVVQKALEMLERRRVQERLENKADNIISKTLEGAIDRALGQIGMNEL